MCACVHLTRPAGDARLNSARTLASPKAFSSIHMTGKSKGKMGRTPINCKFNVICHVTNTKLKKKKKVWLVRQKIVNDRSYLKLKEIVAGRSEAGCITKITNSVDE